MTARRWTEAEERRLWQRRDRGDLQARGELIEGYCFLVDMTMRRVMPVIPKAIDPEDVKSECLLVLVRSVDQYDWKRGCKFTSYAITRLRCACLEYLRKEDWVPRSVRDLAKRIARAEVRAQELHPDREIGEAGIAAVLGWSVEWLARRRQDALPLTVLSLEDFIREPDPWGGSNPLAMAEVLADPDPGPAERSLLEQQKRAMRAALAWLPVEEREAIQAYYDEGLTTSRFGERIGKSQARVQQRRDQGIRRLRYLLKAPASQWLTDGA